MKKLIDIKRFGFYLLLGLAYILLWMWHDTSTFEATFLQAVLNNVWRVVYIVVLNLIFFEYTVPFVLHKRKYILFNILLGIVALWVHLMFWSYGLYAWRSLGVKLHIYTPLGVPSGVNVLVTSQMAFSAGSVFFFGIIRHIYNYIKLKQATQQLRIEKQAAELNYLRSQTNPHFSYNIKRNIFDRRKIDSGARSFLSLASE